MTVQVLRKKTKQTLIEYLVEDADIIGDIVTASVLDVSRSDMLLALQNEVTAQQTKAAYDIVQKLMTGMPIQYVLGECYFYGLPIKIGKGCFIPRSDTELLVNNAIKRLLNGGKFADICSGSGCISKAVATHRPDVKGIALDYYPKPLEYSAINLSDCSNVEVKHFDALDEAEYKALGILDMIICNPPYIPTEDIIFLDTNVQFEPETALDGGEGGLKFYKAVIEYGSKRLNENGIFLFEAGIKQADDVEALLQEKGFITESMKDLGGILRVVIGTRQ
ncbi:MAG: protein-(glutamine-N5) methyltransferase, release factor-specific [Clostridiales bacterium GWF2_38_85]|nr:MAG: protein-(glutamine-N5) methyltransferase, release factor-specific [Clostridiales bacterium GWF2_38_85]HBL83877.1 peptide chain release factor N(5)-glutamine methyltransferase [Clostridiales bacterium]